MAHSYRIFIPTEEDSSNELTLPARIKLDAADSHHLHNVLRLNLGSTVIAVSRTKAVEYQAQLSQITPFVELTLLAKAREATPAICPVKSIIFALCKPAANDLVCEKACELGVEHIIFWQAERSIMRVSPSDIDKKLDRWRRISISAAQQSGKCFQAQVSLIQSLNHLESLLKTEGRRLCCSLLNRSIPIQKLNPALSAAHLLIGPSADFSTAEEQQIEKLGFELISLGPYRLRSEKAAITAIAMVNALAVQT